MKKMKIFWLLLPYSALMRSTIIPVLRANKLAKKCNVYIWPTLWHYKSAKCNPFWTLSVISRALLERREDSHVPINSKCRLIFLYLLLSVSRYDSSLSHLRIREWVNNSYSCSQNHKEMEEGMRRRTINYVRMPLTDYPERPVDKSHISSDQIQGFHKAPMRGPYILYLENIRIIWYSWRQKRDLVWQRDKAVINLLSPSIRF